MKVEKRNGSLSPCSAKDGGKDGDEFVGLDREHGQRIVTSNICALAEQQPILSFGGFFDGDGNLVGKITGRFSAVRLAIVGANGCPGTQQLTPNDKSGIGPWKRADKCDHLHRKRQGALFQLSADALGLFSYF
jgi:hypothetical protein